MKRFRLLIITTLLALSTSFSAFAGSWEEDSKGWWYKNDDGSYPRSTWFTFATTGKQYYFNNEGYLLVNTTTPDGYKVGSDGAYLESDPSNIAKAKSTKSGSYVNSGPGVVGSAGGPVQGAVAARGQGRDGTLILERCHHARHLLCLHVELEEPGGGGLRLGGVHAVTARTGPHVQLVLVMDD